MSQVDAQQYLVARGHKVSLPAVKAWTQGLYFPPAAVFLDLWRLQKVLEEDGDLPPEAPASIRALSEMLSGTRAWFEETHVDPQTGDEI